MGEDVKGAGLYSAERLDVRERDPAVCGSGIAGYDPRSSVFHEAYRARALRRPCAQDVNAIDMRSDRELVAALGLLSSGDHAALRIQKLIRRLALSEIHVEQVIGCILHDEQTMLAKVLF